MSAIRFMLTVGVIIALASSLAYASDPSPLQDFCVADNNSTIFVNGRICKDPNTVVPEDFFASGLNIRGNTSNPFGSVVTRITVDQLPGLNTLGISVARIDFAPYGVNTPHHHPRATELFVLLEGTVYAGFVTSNPTNPSQRNRLFAKTLYPGDMFVFPQALIHFILNVGDTNAVGLSGFSSQNPGVITTANAVFGSNPRIPIDVLTTSFQVSPDVIEYLEAQFWWNNN